MKKRYESDLDFLKEIEAWLSFNCNPDESNISALKRDLRIYIPLRENGEEPTDILFTIQEVS